MMNPQTTHTAPSGPVESTDGARGTAVVEHGAHDGNPDGRIVDPRAGERGWVLVSALVLSMVAASITVGWARHAVLSKGQLEFSNGASRTEEAARSGLERTKEQMRNGDPPGPVGDGDDGDEDDCGGWSMDEDDGETVNTPQGDRVTSCSREKEKGKGNGSSNKGSFCDDEDDDDKQWGHGWDEDDGGNGKRRIDIEVEHDEGGDHRKSTVRANCDVVPTSKNGKGKNGKRTCIGKDKGSKINLIPGLTMITGTMVFTPSSDLSGVYLLEPGATIVLEDNTLSGVILTRSALDPDYDYDSGTDRCRIEIRGSFDCTPGTDYPGLSICAPDGVVDVDADARIDIGGMVVSEDIFIPAKGVLRGMVVTEGTEEIGTQISRPGAGRGPQDFPDYMSVGSERMTRIAFPSDVFTEDEYELIEGVDVFDN